MNHPRCNLSKQNPQHHPLRLGKYIPSLVGCSANRASSSDWRASVRTASTAVTGACNETETTPRRPAHVFLNYSASSWRLVWRAAIVSIVSLERQIALIYIAHDQVRFGPDRVSRHHISLPSSVLTYSSPDGYIYIFLFSRGLGREGHLGRSMTAKGCDNPVYAWVQEAPSTVTWSYRV